MMTQSCSGSPTLRPGAMTASIMFGGANRMYQLYVPSSYKPEAPAPLVLWFHGILGSSQDYRTSGFQEVADREGFLLVAPEGTDTAWNIGPCCTARRRNVDDVGFAKAIVAEMKAKACIDSRRVYAAGFSMGGGMSHYLGCHAADVFAAVAPSAFDLLQENVEDCKPVRPISVASFRNKADNFVYYDGTPDSTPPNTAITGDTSTRINILGALKTLEAWGKIDGCSGAAEPDGTGCQTYKTCGAGAEVTLCTEDDPIAGHHPGPADQMWQRLKRFQLP
jgi:polyhydroxybutyrate depolymerase